MKKLLSTVMALLLLFSFSACEQTIMIPKHRILEELLGGFPVELMNEILAEPSPADLDLIGDGTMSVLNEEKTKEWQKELDDIYLGVAEPGTVLNLDMSSDLMNLWFHSVVNNATFELTGLTSETLPVAENGARYTAELTFTFEDGTTEVASISGTVQCNEEGVANYLSINSFQAVYAALGVEELNK